MHKFKDLLVWQKSLDLAEAVYQFCKAFPTDEKFNLEAQIKRSVVSISSNIAEGAGWGSNNEFKHFIMVALGSSFELETQVVVSRAFKIWSAICFRSFADSGRRSSKNVIWFAQ